MRKCIGEVLKGAEDKKRGFLETIELQVGLKNYDPQKDKRFAGTIKLPHIPRPKLRICILGDAFHCEKAAGLGLDFKNADGLKAFNKNKKLIKKFAKKYQVLLPSPAPSPLPSPSPSPSLSSSTLLSPLLPGALRFRPRFMRRCPVVGAVSSASLSMRWVSSVSAAPPA